MAAYAAVASLMNNIEHIMNHPHLSASLDDKQIQPLLETAGFLLDFIEGCNPGGVMSKEVEDLERQIASAAHAAEDVIESHVVNQIHAGSIQVSCSLHLQQIVEDMDSILRKANELKEKQGFREEQPAHSRRLLMETAMVGFEEEVNQLMDKLTSHQSNRHVISIVGMGGTGKTTLTQHVYKNLLIKHHFDIRAWATVSQQYNAQDILSQLLSDLGNVGQPGENLHKTLYGRRYLIILDDIWNSQAWDEVRRFLPDNGNGSRVVLTTRLSNVARDCVSNYSISMKPLDEDKSWELLCKKTFGEENCPYPHLEKVGKEISRLCKGLPLSTIVIGGLLLNSPRSLQSWKNVVSNMKSGSGLKEKEESLDILSLSYDQLPPHLKPCFLYMGVFKEDSEIRVSNLIRLWIAEGFVRPKNTPILEEVAEGYLEELIDRNLISISKHRKNGKMGSCRIHDLMRDLCLKVGQQHNFFHVLIKRELGGSTERRLILPKSEYGMLVRGRALARSIMACHIYADEATSCKLLRVWYSETDLNSPEKLCTNVNLRYLAFSLSFKREESIWELPSSVFLLWNLQTLIIQEYLTTSDSIVVAPIEVWKVGQLKHIQCTKIYVPSDGLFMMDKLQTLTTAVNLRLSKEVCKMIPNIKKLHLLYHGNLRGYNESLLELLHNLGCLHKLESLRLIFRRIRQLTTKSELNKKLAFPTRLKKLSLSGCKLGWEDLRMIGLLPELEVLELGISSVMVGNKWSPSDKQFLQLKFLKIDWCNLEYWEADESHFPALEKLILSGLGQLEEIPSGIGEIPTLELIRVEYCSESAAISALRIKKDLVENQGDDGLQIQLRMSASVLERFEEKAKTEELTINDIQLEIR